MEVTHRTNANGKPRLSTFTRWVTVICFLVYMFLPLRLVVDMALKGPVAPSAWVKSFSWAAVMISGFFYAKQRCSSDELLFDDGMRYVASSMRVWGTSASFLLMLPVLFLFFLLSVVLALINDLLGRRGSTPENFERLIGIVYKHRLIR